LLDLLRVRGQKAMSSFVEILVSISILIGAFFVFLAALGVYRMPDLFSRCHASSKASTIGKVFPFFAISLYFLDGIIALKAFLAIVFFFFTVPVGAHLISRAGYARGAKKWKKTVLDEYSSATVNKV